MRNQVPVTSDDRKESYFKYFEMEMAPQPEEKLSAIEKGPGNPADALNIHNRNDLFNPGYLPGEFGYWTFKDGTAMIANLTKMPGVTSEMFAWWFAWHQLKPLRYSIWDNEDHYYVSTTKPERSLDPNIPLMEKNWGQTHLVLEDIGLGKDWLIIEFESPETMGYEHTKVGTEACGYIACANGHGPKMGEGLPPVVMTHFIREIDGGVELRSRFWFGYRIINGQAVKAIPDGVKIPELAPLSLLKHNVKEFTNLAKILPLVYAEEFGKPML